MSLQYLKKTIVVAFIPLWLSGMAMANPVETCLEKIEDAGYKVKPKSVEVRALDTGLVRYSWADKDIKCETINDEVIRLIISDEVLIQDGFPSAGAANLFAYMRNANTRMLENCKARHFGVIETFETIYLPKLTSFDADLEEIKAQFEENFSKVSRDFYVEKYYEHQAPLKRLAAYDDLLVHGERSELAQEECIFVADEALKREEGFRTEILELSAKIDTLEVSLKKRDETVVRLQNDLSKALNRERALIEELRKFEKPLKLAQIEESLNSKRFKTATDLLEEINRKFALSKNEKKRMEILAIEAVRPIPAADREANRQGYEFLSLLDESNLYYKNKLRAYSK